jgi:hypothetical protein
MRLRGCFDNSNVETGFLCINFRRFEFVSLILKNSQIGGTSLGYHSSNVKKLKLQTKLKDLQQQTSRLYTENTLLIS